jgi:hypothetical protein
MPDFSTGISTGLSLFSASEGADAANEASSIEEAQLQYEIERDQFNREQVEQMNLWTEEDREDFMSRRDRERGLLDPVQEGLVDRAMEGPQYEEAAARSDADVRQAYGLQRDMERRRQQKYGIHVGSGARMAESRRLGNEEALAQVQGRERARISEDDRDWARKLAVMGTGNQRGAQANANLAQLGVGGVTGIMGQHAQGYRNEAASAFSLFGKTAADAGRGFDRSFSSGTDAFTRPTSPASTLNTWRDR